MIQNTPSDISKWDEHDLQAFIKGNAAAFRLFASRYIKDPDVIDDMLQEAYLKLWSHRHRIGQVQSPRNYFYSILKNTIIDHRDYFPRSNLRQPQEDYTQLPDDSTFLQDLIEIESSNIIAQSILQLSPQSQNVVLMTLEGKSLKEIAASLQITINTVKTIKYRALKRLSEILSKEDFMVLLVVIDTKKKTIPKQI